MKHNHLSYREQDYERTVKQRSIYKNLSNSSEIFTIVNFLKALLILPRILVTCRRGLWDTHKS
jgi:hypothetical protein